jgi:regulatory protein
MSDDEKRKQAWKTALRLLAASPKSRQELSQKLSEKGYSDGVIRDALDLLEKQNILNDRGYASHLLNRYRTVQPSGRRRLAFELKRHGIPFKIREEMLSEVNPEDEAQRAREVGKERWGRLSRLPEEKRKKRVYDFLLRRGFDFQIARDLVEELGRETKPE